MDFLNPVENNRVFLFQHLHHQFLAPEAEALPISLGFPDSLQMTQLGNALKLAAELIVKCNGHHTDRPSMSQHLWYVRRNGEKSGPFPAGQLREMFSLGQLDLKDEVSLDDHAWVKLRETDILEAEPKHQSPTEYDDEVWRLEREKAKLRWISDSVEVASGEGKGPVTDESVARLRRHEAETRVLVDAQSKKRPAFVAGLISVLVLLLIGFGVWKGQSGSTGIVAPLASSVRNCAHPPVEGVVWAGCDKSDASMPNAILRNANLIGTRFERADLAGADLSYANLDSANMRNASLRGAVLKGASLNQTDLTGADLSGADLSFAVLTGAKIDGANLEGASLRQSTWIDGHVCGDQSVGTCR